jgi:hypothetical protein
MRHNAALIMFSLIGLELFGRIWMSATALGRQ